MTIDELKTTIGNVRATRSVPAEAKPSIIEGLISKYNNDNNASVSLADLGL